MNKAYSSLWLIAIAALAAQLGLGLPGFDFLVKAQQEQVPPELLAYADMVLYNGKVLTADDKFTIAEAVAIRDGKFMAVGNSDEIRRLAGPNTRRIDLKGRSVVPGFIDTHQHLHNYAMRWVEGEMPRLRFGDLESGLNEIKEIAAAARPGEWIITSTRPYSARQLNRKLLDPITPNNPLVIQLSSEEFTLNSAAWEAAEIPPDTSGVVKDPQTGEPTGRIFGGTAAGLISYEVLPWTPIEKLIPALKKEMLRENAWGITTVTTRITPDALTALKEMWGNGELTMRWRVAHQFIDLNPDVEGYLKRMGSLSGFGDDWLKIIGATIVSVDSAITRGGAWTFKPKLRELPGDLSGPYGVARIQEREGSDARAIILANKYRWRITSIHSAGDRANSELLAVYEAANKEYPIVGRNFGIDHGPMLTEEHAKKIKELGVIPSIQMKYVFSDPRNLVHMYGADAVHRMTLLKTLIESGVKPAGGADTAEDPYGRPLWNIEKAVTRKDEKGQVWGADQKISRQQALWMYTNWAAPYLGPGEEKKLGTIEAGKLADLVVLADDFMKVPEDMISEIPVVMTIVGGKAVYEAADK